MNHEHLDRLSRVLAAPSVLPRRGALAILGATVLGTLVGAGATSTEAKPKSRHAAKRKKGGRKRAQKRGQKRGQEGQGGGATTPSAGTGGGGCTSQSKSQTCAGLCGMIGDNCGREVDCGNFCSGANTCGGGGVPNLCGCTSQDLATTCAGKCGVVTDDCGREVTCGNTCSGVNTCGGGGTVNTCGCTSQPNLVTCEGKCGMETDNCGRQVNCGTCPNGGGCFIAGTQVRMADGSDKAIELIEPGDRVLGRGGRINYVSSVLYPVLGDQPLYALNGGTAFVTASHPFLTTDGWKAVDPEAARAEVPELPIARLTVGDVLVAATAAAPAGRNAEDGATDVDEHQIPLLSLEGRPADAATQLYNLDVDGDDTYVANGLVVHNKYR